MENDENKNPDVPQDADPSIEQTKDTVNEEERTIPYARFKEINDGYKQTKAELESLKGELETLKTSKPKEEVKEPETWEEVEERAAKRAISQIEAKLKAERQQEAETEKVIEKGFDQLVALGQKITPEVKKQVLEEIVKTGDSVHDAYLAVKSKIEKKETSDQIKVEGQLPTSKGGEDKHIAIPYKDIHRLSMDQLIARAQNTKK